MLEKKYITIDMEGNNQFEKLHELQSMLKQRLFDIKEADKPQGTFAGSAIMHPENL